ncbi:hypothetical protein [Thalassobacillus hwangdonensis]|uniref:Permease n=1 Tax=Thalassobacillus hwangdonensis TaxID=546108 RepID=A0ABW3L129_9BACI
MSKALILRKTIATIVAPLITVAILVFGGNGGVSLEIIGGVIFIFRVIFPYVLLYGVPVSFLSDFLTRRFTKENRIYAAFGIHLIFGLLFAPFYAFLIEENTYIINMIFVGATMIAFCFWIIDEVLRGILMNNDRES